MELAWYWKVVIGLVALIVFVGGKGFFEVEDELRFEEVGGGWEPADAECY